MNLIDKERLIDSLFTEKNNNINILKIIDAQPIVESRIRAVYTMHHAEALHQTYQYFVCSYCHTSTRIPENYCPCCGAKMEVQKCD